MRTVAVVSRKGGVGKTTLCVHLAACAALHKRRALLIDTDPQPSAAGWLEDRREANSLVTKDFPAVVTATVKELRQVLKEARGQFDLVIIDTPPYSGSEAAAACALASLVLIPCRPSKLDLRSIASTLRIVELAQVPAAVVLSQVPARGTVGDEAAADLQGRATVCPVRLGARVAYSYAMFDGRSVFEYEPGGQAAQEVQALYKWTMTQAPASA